MSGSHWAAGCDTSALRSGSAVARLSILGWPQAGAHSKT
jgi:hypothetical protein